MSGQPLTLICGVPGPDSQTPCVRQTWRWAGRWTRTGWLMRRAAVQRRHAVTARTGWPLFPPKAGRAFLMAAAAEPLITASLAAASSAREMSEGGCQRSSCQRVLTRNQGGRMSSRASRLVRLSGGEAAEERCEGFSGHRGSWHWQRCWLRGPGCGQRRVSAHARRVAARDRDASGCRDAPSRGRALPWSCRGPGRRAQRAGRESAGAGRPPAAAGSRRRTGRSRRPGRQARPACGAR